MRDNQMYTGDPHKHIYCRGRIMYTCILYHAYVYKYTKIDIGIR